MRQQEIMLPMNNSAPLHSPGSSCESGWTASADAWIATLGTHGDFARQFVLDRPMLERIDPTSVRRALDVGCGECRFCRMLGQMGISTLGIDPVERLVLHARDRDPEGDYQVGRAEAIDLPDASVDLVVSYLSLIDIDDVDAAIPEMARVLRPGGTLLIANLTSFNTAGQTLGWADKNLGLAGFAMDHYMEERANWVAWRGVKVRNWHRPMSRYMTLLLNTGLQLVHFSEPAPTGGDPVRVARYVRAPYFLVMEWRKPMSPLATG